MRLVSRLTVLVARGACPACSAVCGLASLACRNLSSAVFRSPRSMAVMASSGTLKPCLPAMLSSLARIASSRGGTSPSRYASTMSLDSFNPKPVLSRTIFTASTTCPRDSAAIASAGRPLPFVAVDVGPTTNPCWRGSCASTASMASRRPMPGLASRTSLMASRRSSPSLAATASGGNLIWWDMRACRQKSGATITHATNWFPSASSALHCRQPRCRLRQWSRCTWESTISSRSAR